MLEIVIYGRRRSGSPAQPCNFSRREFLKGGTAALGGLAAAMPEAFARAVRLRHDPDLTVLIADCHINGR